MFIGLPYFVWRICSYCNRCFTNFSWWRLFATKFKLFYLFFWKTSADSAREERASTRQSRVHRNAGRGHVRRDTQSTSGPVDGGKCRAGNVAAAAYRRPTGNNPTSAKCDDVTRASATNMSAKRHIHTQLLLTEIILTGRERNDIQCSYELKQHKTTTP